MTAAASTLSPAAALDAIVSALRRGDVAKADTAFAAAAGNIDADALTKLAELNVRRRRWADAAWLFDRVPDADRTPAVAFRRNLCRNLAAFSVHHPRLCELLSTLPPDDRVTIAASGTGHPTIAVRDAAGDVKHLSPGDRPLAAASDTLNKLRTALNGGACIGLAGIGDGYLLYRLAGENPPLLLGMQVPVFAVEPDPYVALHALMIHDYAGAGGPIAQDRFRWFVGPTWADDLRAALSDDVFLPPPAVVVTLGQTGAEVAAALRPMSAEIAARDAEAKARVEAYYANHRPEELAELMSPGATRKPRVLIVTTRFSTVLQYSSRDAAAAFERLGWDARLLIEETPSHRLMQCGTRRAMDEFRPDLAFQIDHLRHEHGLLFPPNLPFACWVQDYLPNLACESAGRAIGPTDFALTGEALTCVHEYRYPAAQCVGLTKLTSVPEGPAELSDDAREVVFVSNASRPPAALLAEFLATIPPESPSRRIVATAADRILTAYAAGDAVCTYVGVREIVEAAAADLGVRGTKEVVRQMASWLYHPFVDALYRQQALGWAADACAELGLSLGLYGNGWESHPTLAAHARGPIANGPPLHDLTRRSAFNLQVVPYMCLHPRLLDGLMAGGLFLVRQHPSDVAPAALLDVLLDHGDPAADTEFAARASLAAAPADVRRRFDDAVEAVRDCACSSGTEDPVAYVRAWQAAGMVEPRTGVLPRFADVAFRDAASLKARMVELLSDRDRRRAIHAEQRASVRARFSYDGGLARAARDIADRLVAHAAKGRGMGQAA